MHGSCSTTASHILNEILHYRRRFSGSDQEISLENDIVTLTQLPRIQTFISANLNRPRFPRHSPGSLRNAFQTLPVTADC